MKEIRAKLKEAEGKLAELEQGMEHRRRAVRQAQERLHEAATVATAALDDYLLGKISEAELSTARANRDEATKAVNQNGEEVEAAERLIPKVAGECSRLGQDLNRAVERAYRARFAELQAEVIGRIDDLLPKLFVVCHALDMRSPAQAIFAAIKSPPPDELAAQVKELRADVIENS